MKRLALLLPLLALALPALAQDPATNAAAFSSAVPPWPGLGDLDRIRAWGAAVATNDALPTVRGYRERARPAALREELLRAFDAGPDAEAPWAGEARALLSRYATNFTGCAFLTAPTSFCARVAAFAETNGCADPALLWIGSGRWQEKKDGPVPEGAGRLLAALDAAAEGPRATPLGRFLAASARQRFARGEEARAAAKAEALRRGAAWATDFASRPGGAEPALDALEWFFGARSAALAEALETTEGADPWLAGVVRGGAEIDAAWAARGSGWGSTVTREGWKGFSEHLGRAREALVRAWEAHPELPQAPAAMLSVAGGGGGGGGELDLWFGRAVAARIDHVEAWWQYSWFNHPRWGGSVQRVLRIARGADAAGHPGSMLPFCFVQIVDRASVDGGASPRARRAFWEKRGKLHERFVEAGRGVVADPATPGDYRKALAWTLAQDLAAGGDAEGGIALRASAHPGDLFERLQSEVLVPFAVGPGMEAPWGDRGWGDVQLVAQGLADASLFSMPNNRGWGSFYDRTVREGGDDPVLCWGSVVGQRKWGWNDRAREQLSLLEERLAGGGATRFQRMLAAQARQMLDPSPTHAAAFVRAAGRWRASLGADLPAERIDRMLDMLGYGAAAAAAPEAAADPAAPEDPGAEAAGEDGPAAGTAGANAAGAATAAAPPPGTHADFVARVYLPLLEAEILAPLEALDAGAPWRADALAAVRGFLERFAREERRPDPRLLARASSADGRGCEWPFVRALAAWHRLLGQDEDEHARGKAARAMSAAALDLARDPGASPLAAFVLLRQTAAALAEEGAAPDPGLGAALGRTFAALAAARPWRGEEARALWWLARGAFGSDEAAARAEGAVWPESGPAAGAGGAATNAWLRDLALGDARMCRAWAARAEAAAAPAGGPAAAEALARWEGERALARESFARAAAREPAFPEAPRRLLEAALGDKEEMRRRLDETLRREPDCPGARSLFLWGLRPEWGGSHAEMLAFGDECLAALDADPAPDPRETALVWAEARFAVASGLGAGWEEPFRGAAAVEAADRLCAALLAAPGAGVQERKDALWLPVWPLWANNRFDRLAVAADRAVMAEGDDARIAVGFDPSHPMNRHASGMAAGLCGPRHEKVAAALSLWRVAGDPAGARAAFEALRDGAAPANGIELWERSFVEGRLAVLGALLSARTGEPYELVPREGWSGREGFWATWNSSVRLSGGAWRCAYRGTGELRSAEPVLPADCALAATVSADGAAASDPAVPVRLYLLPDMGEWDSAARPALLAAREDGRWTLGWARLRHVDDALSFGRDEIAERFGPRVGVDPGPDGAVRFELRLRGGDAEVLAAGGPLPALALPGAFAAAPHRLGLAGRAFAATSLLARGLIPETKGDLP